MHLFKHSGLCRNAGSLLGTSRVCASMAHAHFMMEVLRTVSSIFLQIPVDAQRRFQSYTCNIRPGGPWRGLMQKIVARLFVFCHAESGKSSFMLGSCALHPRRIEYAAQCAVPTASKGDAVTSHS